MFIKEVCRRSGLTKKAVDYYEQQEFLTPQVLENGYRDYSEADLALLQELCVLRQCGLTMSDIRMVLQSRDKAVAIARYRHLNTLKLARLQAAQQSLDRLSRDYNIPEAFALLEHPREDCLTIREKLLLAFPGNYGLYLSLHFGQFLNEPLQTPQQLEAFQKIVEYLDHVPTSIPQELEDYMEQALQLQQSMDLEQFEQGMHQLMEESLGDPAEALEKLPFDVEEYIAYRTSEEFKHSPQGKMTELMTRFQTESGYQDIFLANLKLLSPAYAQYCTRLEAANQRFLERYPEAQKFYEF